MEIVDCNRRWRVLAVAPVEFVMTTSDHVDVVSELLWKNDMATWNNGKGVEVEVHEKTMVVKKHEEP